MKIADISAWNGTIDWAKARTELEMVIFRASVGMKEDAKYKTNAAQCGLPYGVYHYIKASSTAAARDEADWFVQCASAGKPAFYILDVEYEAQTASNTEDICIAFLTRLRERGIKRIGMYVGQPHINWIGSAKALCDIVWIPRWGKDDGTINESYAPTQACDLWQYTSKGCVAGIDGNVDLNAYRGGRVLQWFADDRAIKGETGMPTNLELANYCEQVYEAAWVYWYGSCGYQCTQSLYNSKRQQYPEHYTSDRTSGYMKDIANGKMCADCVGMIKSFFWKNGNINGKNTYQSNGCPDRSADGLFALCDETGQISTIPDIPGLVVHKPGHIGVYVGGGYTVEMKGFAYDCVRNKVTDGPWTEWGRLPSTMIEYVGIGTIGGSKLGARTIKKGVKGSDVKELQEALIALGYALPRYGADGDCGGETIAAITQFQKDHDLEADGVAGKATIAAIKAAMPKQDEENGENDTAATPNIEPNEPVVTAPADPAAYYTLVIYDLSRAEVEELMAKYPRSEIAKG